MRSHFGASYEIGDKSFAEALKHARAACGLSQAALGRMLSISVRTIEGWETERRTPPRYVGLLILKSLEGYFIERLEAELINEYCDER